MASVPHLNNYHLPPKGVVGVETSLDAFSISNTNNGAENLSVRSGGRVLEFFRTQRTQTSLSADGEDAKNAEDFRDGALRALRLLCVLCELIFQTTKGTETHEDAKIFTLRLRVKFPWGLRAS
jgi:hypothetical protein